MLKGICTTVAAPLLSVVTGTVQDASTGEAVIGAAVILQNTTYGAVADADGRFVINNVSRALIRSKCRCSPTSA